MAKQFKVLVNTGKDQEVQTFNAEQGAGLRGRAVIIKAQAGAKYQLVEVAKRNNLAPDNIKAKRVGKNLHLMFETDSQADVIIEDYYSVIGDSYNAVIGKRQLLRIPHGRSNRSRPDPLVGGQRDSSDTGFGGRRSLGCRCGDCGGGLQSTAGRFGTGRWCGCDCRRQKCHG